MCVFIASEPVVHFDLTRLENYEDASLEKQVGNFEQEKLQQEAEEVIHLWRESYEY